MSNKTLELIGLELPATSSRVAKSVHGVHRPFTCLPKIGRSCFLTEHLLLKIDNDRGACQFFLDECSKFIAVGVGLSTVYHDGFSFPYAGSGTN